MSSNRTLELSIRGMTCGSCVRHVTEALQSVAGVDRVAVDLDAGGATLTYDAARATPERLVGAVVDAGYPASVVAANVLGVRPSKRGCGCGACT